MDKYSLYRGVAPSGHPLIHLIEPGTRYGLRGTAGLEKTASGEHLPEVLELVESICPQPGRLYLVNSAIGAGEYVGVNLRGDWFTEQGINHKPLNWDKIPVWDIDACRRAANTVEPVNGKGNLAWGFPTFYNAHRFRHHQNSDPNRAYGYILGAFWDQRMHRVVLVSELIREMCERLGAVDIYDRIAGGQFCDSSMGARVPSDECMICGNEARSPTFYCRHVNGEDMQYGMGKILPDGRVCGVKNHYPRFFDDSFVFVGAERSAKVMTNMTSKVKGQNKYSQTIYPFKPQTTKTASHPEMATGLEKVVNEIEEQKRRKPATIEQHIVRVLDLGPLATPKEKAVYAHVENMKKGKAAVGAGKMDRFDLDLWERTSRRILENQHQLSDKDIDTLIQRYEQRSSMPEKRATVKWADMLKELPAPDPAQLSLLRAHERAMPGLPPDVMNMFSEDPATALATAAHLGVILRPEEFQRVILQKMSPGTADEYTHKGTIFAPQPLDLENETPNWQHMETVKEIAEKIRAVLLPLLKERSMAPAAVRIQIMMARPAPTSAANPLIPDAEDPLLQKVSSLYNEYRAGLLADPPNWRDVPVEGSFSSFGEEDDLVQQAQDLSRQLLALAYWPSFPVG